MERKTRNANYELLRIIAMAMVIILHYLKGGFLPEFSEPFSGQDYLAWMIEGFCLVAVNVYVLISGYFMVESDFRLKKLGGFWLQVLFYSIGVPAVLCLTGIYPISAVRGDHLLTWLFPILREHYWFATVYVFLFLLSPFLAAAAKAMEKKVLQRTLLVLLLLCSVGKSILPFNLAQDTGGYDILWFVCLFLTAAYIRLHGLGILQKGKNGLWLYLSSVAGIFFLSACYRAIYQKTGKLGDFYGSAYQYNHIFCFTASVGLFLLFGGISVRNKTAERWIIRIASCTFGIYLLHENEAVRDLWQGCFAKAGFLPGMILSVICIYGLGIIVELVRQKLFALCKRKNK